MQLIILLSTMFAGLPPEEEARLAKEGWVAVARPEPIEEIFEDGDPSIWTVFSKKELDEEFIVRFPTEPVYSYEGAQMRVFAEADGKAFLLTVEPKEKFTSYRSAWGQERVIFTSKNVYVLQSNASPAEHQKFIDSLEIV